MFTQKRLFDLQSGGKNCAFEPWGLVIKNLYKAFNKKNLDY